MSNHDNHRRGDKKRTEHGPRWENGGSDNSSVARSRKTWKLIGSRTERRTGQTSKFFGKLRIRPSASIEEGRLG